MPDSNDSLPAHFPIPSSFQFEPELQGEPPREVPADLALSAAERKSRRVTILVIVAGLVCMALSPLPQVQFLGQFILPLEYLLWIGLAMAVLATFALVKKQFQPRSNLWIRDAEPVAAKIVSIVKRPAAQVEGQLVNVLVVTFEFLHPFYQQVMQQHVQTERTDVPFRQGDFVTALYMPDAVNGALQLYPLMGFRREQASDGWGELIKSLGQVLMVILFISVPLFFLYAIMRWMIRDELTLLYPFIVGAVALGIPVCLLWHWGYRANLRKIAERNAMALEQGGIVEEPPPVKSGFIGIGIGTGMILILGVMLMLGCAFLSVALMLNAVLDTSPPKLLPVTITSLSSTTHSMLFCEYEIGYEFADDPDHHKFHTSRDHLKQFRHGEEALAVSRAGYFGWEWMEDIRKK
jgi:hypothetical protein